MRTRGIILPSPLQEPSPIEQGYIDDLVEYTPLSIGDIGEIEPEKPVGPTTIPSGLSVSPMSQYLSPFLQLVQRQNQEELTSKIGPYVNEVQQITDKTFPNVFSSGGLGSIYGIFGGGGGGPRSTQPFGNEMNTPHSEGGIYSSRSKGIDSLISRLFR